LVQLESASAGEDLLAKRFGSGAIALAEKTEIHRVLVGCLEHAMNIPDARSARGGIGSMGRASAAPNHRRDAACEGMLDLLRADEVDVRIDAAGRDNAAFASDHLGGCADDHSG